MSRESAAKDYPRSLSSVGTYSDLKGQVILCRLTNLSETSERNERRQRFAFPIESYRVREEAESKIVWQG